MKKKIIALISIVAMLVGTMPASMIFAADAAKSDHILYYDSATSKLYTKMDYETKEFSEPIDSFPGAICEGNKLTLTSDFQFVTTAKDGLFIDGNTTLYVPEGENPSILSAADGFTGDDKLGEYTGIFAADGSTIDIDGSLTVRSGTGTEASSRAILSDGDLTITGKGELTAVSGDTEHDEAAEPARRDSLGIYVYGDLDISVAKARFSGGSAYGISFGIVTDEGRTLTVSGGASVTAESGETRGEGQPYDDCYSTALTTGNLTVKDNSSLTASAAGSIKSDSYGICIMCGDVRGDGVIYNGSITLENNSTLKSSTSGSDRSFGIWCSEGVSVPVKTDGTCTFTVEGTMKAAHYAELLGVVAVSADGEVLSYTRGTDKLTNSYVDKQGNIAKYITFKNPADVAVDNVLYFDGETGRLYSEYDSEHDYEPGVMSDPVEVPGAICEKNKLTLTSEFRFVTTNEDGLILGEGATLYVPEGETPLIYGGAAGVKFGGDVGGSTGLLCVGDNTLEIDGDLDVIGGDGANISSWGVTGVNKDKTLNITGNGSLTARGGNVVYDETIETSRGDSSGILSYGDLNISLAEVNAVGGDAYACSVGMYVDYPMTEPHTLTISGGADVNAKGGACIGREENKVSDGCAVNSLIIKDNSSLTASTSAADEAFGLMIFDWENYGDGKIELSGNSSLILTALDSANGYGLTSRQEGNKAVIVKMDNSSTFAAEGSAGASVSEVTGVLVLSDGKTVKYDKEKLNYTDADGNIVKKVTFSPKAASHSGGSGSGGYGGGSFGTTGATPSPTSNPTETAAPQPQTSDAPVSEAPISDGMPFNDVKPSDWFYDAVNSAYGKGLVNGVSDTEFGPDQNMTRGMLVTIIGRADGFAESDGALMSDVDPNEFYAPYVAWAAANGIVTGFEDGTFRPDENVTREQTAAILYRYAQYKGGDVSLGESANMIFTDAAQISEYAVPAIQWACGAGIINGYPDGTLAPSASITRAEFVTMIGRTALL